MSWNIVKGVFMKRFIFIVIITVVFGACVSTPSVPQFSFFNNYPTDDNTLVFFRAVGGVGMKLIDTCIITNPADLEIVAELNYDDPEPISILRKWRLDLNAVTIIYNIDVVRSDVAMFDLPNDIKEVGILLYGGYGEYGSSRKVQFFKLPINHEEKRQGFVFTLGIDTIEPEIKKLSNDELENEYKAFYRRYAFQNDKNNKPQVGFIVK
jgi:hypothetical protein